MSLALLENKALILQANKLDVLAAAKAKLVKPLIDSFDS